MLPKRKRLSLTSAVCYTVITHPYSCVRCCCPQFAPHACHSFAGLLTSRSFLDVEPREIILWDVLAPAAAVREIKRLHVARVAYRLQRILGIVSPCLPASVILLLLPVLKTFSWALNVFFDQLFIPSVSSYMPLLVTSKCLLNLHASHSNNHPKCFPLFVPSSDMFLDFFHLLHSCFATFAPDIDDFSLFSSSAS